jgi:hypothetical protein
MKCIFCLQEESATEEHVFPLAIGGHLTTDRVCRLCNSTLGTSADVPLVEHPLVLFKRRQLKIPDRAGNIPDVIGKFVKEGTLTEDPSQKFRLSADHDSDGVRIELLHGEKEIGLPDGRKIKQFSVDASDLDIARKTLGKIIQRERKRNGLTQLSTEELDILISGVIKQEPHGLMNPVIDSTVNLDMFGFKMGLLKIAYELAFRWLGEDYLGDSIAAQIRAVLMARSREQAIAVAGLLRGEMASPYDSLAHAFTPWNDDPNAHVAFSRVVKNSIIMFVRIFTAVAGTVVVTDNAARYVTGPFDPSVVRVIRIAPASGTSIETPFTSEIGRLFLAGSFGGAGSAPSI